MARPMPKDLLETPVGAMNADKLANAQTPFPRGGLKPEQRLQSDIVRALRRMLTPLGGLVLAMNGEMPGGRGGREHRFMRAQMERRIMGYLPGTPDLFLDFPAMFHRGRWPYGFMEVKVPGGEPKLKVRDGRLVTGKTAPGRLSENQDLFRARCSKSGVPWACVRSTDEALAAVKEWGWVNAD